MKVATAMTRVTSGARHGKNGVTVKSFFTTNFSRPETSGTHTPLKARESVMEIVVLMIVVAIGSVVLWVVDAVTSAQRDREVGDANAVLD